MKKCFLSLLSITVISFAGCQQSSDTFLSYEDTVNTVNHSVDHQVTQSNFFAQDIAVITEKENIGGDDLLTSGAILLINVTENETIYADHVFDKMYPASLTKLLTALVVLQQGELTDTVAISSNAVKIADVGARVCGYAEGDIITLDALLYSLIISSGNDAAIAVAEHLGGSVDGFITMMNQEAQRIGAIHSNFVNPHGLHDDNQYTTAYDIYLVMNELLKHDKFREIISSDSYTVEYVNKNGNPLTKILNSTNTNWNDASEVPDKLHILGGLSGTTKKSGRCQVLLSKNNKEQEFISIILKASNDETMNSQAFHLLSMTISD